MQRSSQACNVQLLRSMHRMCVVSTRDLTVYQTKTTALTSLCGLVQESMTAKVSWNCCGSCSED